MKNKSEMLLEGYLRAHGLTFTFETPIPGSSKVPDYTVPFKGQDILLEVKEFQAESGDFGRTGAAFGFDPTPSCERRSIRAATSSQSSRSTAAASFYTTSTNLSCCWTGNTSTGQCSATSASACRLTSRARQSPLMHPSGRYSWAAARCCSG